MSEFDNIINDATKQKSIDYGDINVDIDDKNVSADEKKRLPRR